MSPRFVLFGPAHLTAIALTLMVPLALALLARHEHLGRHADRLARIGLTVFFGVRLDLLVWPDASGGTNCAWTTACP